MAKRGEVVDVETAYRIREQFIDQFPAQVSKDLGERLRPVIWPVRLVPTRFMLRQDELPTCKKLLMHLVCCDDWIEVWTSFPMLNSSNSIRGNEIHISSFEYDGKYMGGFRPRMFMVSSEDREIAIKNCFYDQEEGANLVYSIEPFNDFLQDTEEEMRAMLLQTFALEQWAFDTFTAYKFRPRTKIGGMKPPPKKWPAIEIVSLRKSEKRPDDTLGTHFQYSCQFPVIGYTRRQHTKDGIKLVWVKEHIRGPKDAPLKPKPTKVYKVTR